MLHQQTSARQYARPGCCYDKPIVINDDEQTAPTKTKTKPISTHTATWLEAKARGRWQTPTTTTAESTFTNKATCREERAGERWQGSVNRPAVQAEPSQRCRKRAFADVGGDSDETNGGGKRLRGPEIGMAEGDGCPNQHTSHINTRPFNSNNRYRVINHSRLTKLEDENPASELAELEARLRTMQRNMDLERATVRDIQRAEEQARIQKEEKQAREAEIREQSYRSTVQSSLHKMWQNCDREREAAEERRNTREREEREESKRRERQVEQERVNELSNMEANLKSMWKAHDLERGMPAKIRPGQLSEAGQRRVRERAEKLRRHKQ